MPELTIGGLKRHIGSVGYAARLDSFAESLRLNAFQKRCRSQTAIAVPISHPCCSGPWTRFRHGQRYAFCRVLLSPGQDRTVPPRPATPPQDSRAYVLIYHLIVKVIKVYLYGKLRHLRLVLDTASASSALGGDLHCAEGLMLISCCHERSPTRCPGDEAASQGGEYDRTRSQGCAHYLHGSGLDCERCRIGCCDAD